MANAITMSRIILSFVLLFLPTFSFEFYIIYFICGLTDMIDGVVARKLKTVSFFGERLDSSADFVFVAVCLFKILPKIDLNSTLYIFICIIVLIKIINLNSSLVLYKKVIMPHTNLNKIAGFMLFVFPLTTLFFNTNQNSVYLILTLIVATIAAVQEGHYIRIGKV